MPVSCSSNSERSLSPAFKNAENSPWDSIIDLVKRLKLSLVSATTAGTLSLSLVVISLLVVSQVNVPVGAWRLPSARFLERRIDHFAK